MSDDPRERLCLDPNCPLCREVVEAWRRKAEVKAQAAAVSRAVAKIEREWADWVGYTTATASLTRTKGAK